MSLRKAREKRRAANRAAHATLQQEEQVGLAKSVGTINHDTSKPRRNRTRFLVDTGCNAVTVPHENLLDSGTEKVSQLGIRVAGDRVSTVHKEGSFGGVRNHLQSY